MTDILKDLYNIVEKREAEREEGSYTVYLLDSGLDKILKKLGEETAETIIAAKNLENAVSGIGERAPGGNTESENDTEREALKGEVADLLYHLSVLLYSLGVDPEEVEVVLRERMQKTGNLKKP